MQRSAIPDANLHLAFDPSGYFALSATLSLDTVVRHGILCGPCLSLSLVVFT